jgi:hypothetical protein
MITPFELNHTLNNYLLTLVSVIILILFTLNETTAAGTQHNLLNDSINQNNSLNSTNTKSEPDDKQIVITWLGANETEANNAPIINITSQEFWNAFTPLLEISTNNTINTVE